MHNTADITTPHWGKAPIFVKKINIVTSLFLAIIILDLLTQKLKSDIFNIFDDLCSFTPVCNTKAFPNLKKNLHEKKANYLIMHHFESFINFFVNQIKKVGGNKNGDYIFAILRQIELMSLKPLHKSPFRTEGLHHFVSLFQGFLDEN